MSWYTDGVGFYKCITGDMLRNLIKTFGYKEGKKRMAKMRKVTLEEYTQNKLYEL